MVATYAIGLLKDAAVASTIGVPDLSYQGRYITEMTYQGLSVMGFVGILYIAISLPIAWLSRVTHTRLKRMVAL
jgi:polar amino acid transport system permease protein